MDNGWVDVGMGGHKFRLPDRGTDRYTIMHAWIDGWIDELMDKQRDKMEAFEWIIEQ